LCVNFTHETPVKNLVQLIIIKTVMSKSAKTVVVNGRVVKNAFWETAMRVTYDEYGRPTTHEDDS